MASVLVIDDERGVRQVVRVVLEREGHTVRLAEDGAAGLAEYQREPADLVVCDLFMPEKEGLETIHELRAGSPRLKILAVSGGTTRIGGVDFLPLALGLGADAVLHKPFTADELVAAVRAALRP